MSKKLPPEIREKIIALRSCGLGYREVAAEAGVSLKSAWNICNPKGYKTHNDKLRGTRSEYTKQYNAANKEIRYLACKRWEENNRHKRCAKEARRRINKIMSEPLVQTFCQKWKMEQLYKDAQKMTIETGIPHHVDHIVPLLGKNVCGLHVPWNLQILTASENCRKNNKF